MFKKIKGYILNKFFYSSYENKKSFYNQVFMTAFGSVEDYKELSEYMNIKKYYSKKDKTFYIQIYTRFANKEDFDAFNDELQIIHNFLRRVIYYHNFKMIVKNELVSHEHDVFTEMIEEFDNVYENKGQLYLKKAKLFKEIVK